MDPAISADRFLAEARPEQLILTGGEVGFLAPGIASRQIVSDVAAIVRSDHAEPDTRIENCQ